MAGLTATTQQCIKPHQASCSLWLGTPQPCRVWSRRPNLASPTTAYPQPATSCGVQAHPLNSWGLQRPCQHSRLRCSATSSDDNKEAQPNDNSNLIYTLGMATLWIGISAYAFMLSPNQTPYRDQIFIRLLVGLREADETFIVNQVYSALFNIMGVWPLIYACLLVPAGRSANKLPAWPFITGSMAFGIFSLLPYFTFWRPIKDQQLPPPKEELEGWNRLVMKGAETHVLPAILLLTALYQFYSAFTASGASWLEFGKLVEESRLVHVTTLDFLCLTAFAPFWMYNDAEGRKWEARDTWLPFLTVLPVVGPAVYLLLRPKTDTNA